jgi:magnesium-transporting ATPase (P-type)
MRFSRRRMRCSPALSFYTLSLVSLARLPYIPKFTYTFSSHVAVIAFIGAFVLVTYKLKEEKQEQEKQDVEKHSHLQTRHFDSDGIWSTNPRLEQVGSVRQQAPPIELLKAAHNIAIATAFVGFVFIVVGIMCSVWSQQSRAVSIFSSATLAMCILVSLVIVNPLQKAEKTLKGRIDTLRGD